MKKMIVVAALATVAVLSEAKAAGNPMKWRPGIKADDVAFWRACKSDNVTRAQNEDCATNVKAIQIEGTKTVRITYDADYKDGWPLAVSVEMRDGSTPVPCFSLSGDVGNVPSGKGKVIEWNAGNDWDGKYTENMVAYVRAVPAEHPSSWAQIQISWSAFGGRDLDVCGYWVDKPGVKVGWHHGTGSLGSEYMSNWEGDNTESGPEYINVGVKPGQTLVGVRNKVYKVHCNYYGENGNPPQATIRVNCNGVSMSKTITASTRNRNRAEPSDPCVTITFSEMGELLSVQ